MAILIFRIMDEDSKTQLITGILISLDILLVTLPIALVIDRMYKARPELFYREPNGNQRFKSPHDRFESDEKRSGSTYDGVESDSYRYNPNKDKDKKSFTDFCLEEKTTCFICKLKIDKNEKLYRYPECKSPFHIGHLSEWFNENTDCPVCNIELTL
jgi:hypothetical protein